MTETFHTKRIILDLCGGTGSWSRPYAEAGYDVRVITLPEYDVRLWKGYVGLNVYGILAAPPCTEFSYAKHFHSKGKYSHNFQEGLSIVDACLRIIWYCKPQFWALENPYGYLREWLGKPSLIFNPFDYGDPYPKKTCLWGDFNHPAQTPVKPTIAKFSLLKSRDIHPEFYGKLSRQVRRSITPQGFARAFFEANK
jgi:hypothetical protein